VPTVLQTPIAALTAVCISMPVGVTAVNFESADAAKGCALHTVSSPNVVLAAATSDLKLVLVDVESAVEVGGAAAKSLGQKVEILALPKSLAASVAANGTGGLSNTIVDAGREAAANILAEANQASLTDNIVTRALQGAWNFTFWLGASSKPPLPEGFDPATYVSLSVAFANLVALSVLPLIVANLLLPGQWDDIPTTITSATQKAVNSRFVGLPTSFLQTLNWIPTGNPPTAMLGAAATVDSLQANQASVLAAAPSLTLTDNILTRALQGAWNYTLWLGPSSKPPLPTGFDPTTYTSLSVAAANLINLSLLPLTVANLVLSGHWDSIPSTVTSTTQKAVNSAGKGLPTSFVQTVNWVVTGNPPAAPAVESTLLKASVEGDPSEQDAIAKGDSTETGGSTSEGSATTKHGTLSGIVDNGGGTKGGTIEPGGVIKDILNGGSTKGGSTETGGSSENGGGTTKGSTTKGAHHTADHKLGTKKDGDKGGK
jgi:hypothetical protein